MTTTEALQLLGMASAPTKTAVKKAFRQAALRYHPDARGSSKDFIRIKTAYDLLMALPLEQLTHVAQPKQAVFFGDYDPFTDPDYDQRVFFEPENPASEGFERKVRAKGCKNCHELGFITKNTDPDRGFLGRERRLCRCQWR